MSLRPIDLQTMLMRLTELSREQAAMHDSSVVNKAAAIADSVRKTREADEKVEETREIPDEASRVEDHSEKGGSARDSGSGRAEDTGGNDGDNGEDSGEPENLFHDPDLGNRIDISG